MIVGSVLQAIYLATPLICWSLNACLRKRRLHWAILFVIAGVVGYFVLLAAVQAMEHALSVELYKHDLDGDRAFSKEELTADAELAMERLTNDTGRALAPITGVPLTFVWTSLNFMILGFVEIAGGWLFSLLFRRNMERKEPVTEPTEIPSNTTNPYQPPATHL